MKKDQARENVVAEWLKRDPRHRVTAIQMAMFALAAAERYRFYTEGSRAADILEWLMVTLPANVSA